MTEHNCPQSTIKLKTLKTVINSKTCVILFKKDMDNKEFCGKSISEINASLTKSLVENVTRLVQFLQNYANYHFIDEHDPARLELYNVITSTLANVRCRV